MQKCKRLALCFLIFLFASGCGNKEKPEPAPAPEPAVSKPVEVLPPEEPEPAFINPLSGLSCTEETQKRRPVAIMINNLKKALPQSGISHADILYEAMTEGNISRMLAVFNDYPEIPKIGPVRSARHYFVDLAGSHDAYYIHYGGSPQAYDYIKRSGAEALDGLSALDKVMFYRDPERLKKKGMLEHSAFTTGEMIIKGLSYKGYPVDYVSEPTSAFYFAKNEYMPSGQPCSKLTVPYGYYIEPFYTYDEASKVYLRWQFDEKHIDSETGQQLAFKNILVLYVNESAIKGDSAGRLDIKACGEGNGLYCTNGVAQNIKWTKTTRTNPLKLTTENGTELQLNAGKTFINLLDKKLNAKIEA